MMTIDEQKKQAEEKIDNVIKELKDLIDVMKKAKIDISNIVTEEDAEKFDDNLNDYLDQLKYVTLTN